MLHLLLASLLVAPSAQAGAKVKVNDDVTVDVGLRVQAFASMTAMDDDIDKQFRVRRARLRLGVDITKYASAFMQTDAGSFDGGAGLDMRIIDAFVVFKPHDLAHFYAGMHLIPSSRQALTSSGALMALARPGLVYKDLCWGTRSKGGYNLQSMGATDAGLRSGATVRDVGVTLIGNADLSDNLHLKYYVGAYEGAQFDDTDNPHFSGRVQLNVWDDEKKPYMASTYLGKKKTLGLAVSGSYQHNVAEDADYLLISPDVFLDLPVGEGAVTAEAGFKHLSLGGAEEVDLGEGPTDVTGALGNGLYVQGGYYVSNWQPWAAFETWMADNETGDYWAARVGLTRFIYGHNANVKLGYEYTAPGEASGMNPFHTVVLGGFITY